MRMKNTLRRAKAGKSLFNVRYINTMKQLSIFRLPERADNRPRETTDKSTYFFRNYVRRSDELFVRFVLAGKRGPF